MMTGKRYNAAVAAADTKNGHGKGQKKREKEPKKRGKEQKKRGKSGGLNWHTRCMLCLVPSLLGITVFFLAPFVRVLYYSVISDQFRRKFVWFSNYAKILKSPMFLLAVKNSIVLIAVCVPVLVISALVISLGLSFGLKKLSFVGDAFIFPMFLPVAALVPAWQKIFGGVDNVIPLWLFFIWKNIGICIILLTSALSTVENEIYEAARMDGAGAFTIHMKISVPLIAPSVFFAVLLTVMNSFNIFKESYLYYGSKYPPDYAYSLQFYLNNNFLKFDYQKLAASSVFTTVFVLVLAAAGFMAQRRYER